MENLSLYAINSSELLNYVVAYISLGSVLFFLAIFVFAKNPQNSLNRIFSIYSLLVTNTQSHIFGIRFVWLGRFLFRLLFSILFKYFYVCRLRINGSSDFSIFVQSFFYSRILLHILFMTLNLSLHFHFILFRDGLIMCL